MRKIIFLLVAGFLVLAIDSTLRPEFLLSQVYDGEEFSDRDCDGLSDQLEVKIRSDKNNKDTDGDGIADGIESSFSSFGLRVLTKDSKSRVRKVAKLIYGKRFDLSKDDDGDKLLNSEELLFGTNPLVVDSDGDKIDDKTEVLKLKTCALNPDTDRDGVSDEEELVKGSNPLVADLKSVVNQDLKPRIIGSIPPPSYSIVPSIVPSVTPKESPSLSPSPSPSPSARPRLCDYDGVCEIGETSTCSDCVCRRSGMLRDGACRVCNNNGDCDGSENHENCPADCAVTCNDPDAGPGDQFSQTTTEILGALGFAGGHEILEQKSDFCSDGGAVNARNGVVAERYCINSQTIGTVNRECNNGCCANGACVPFSAVKIDLLDVDRVDSGISSCNDSTGKFETYVAQAAKPFKVKLSINRNGAAAINGCGIEIVSNAGNCRKVSEINKEHITYECEPTHAEKGKTLEFGAKLVGNCCASIPAPKQIAVAKIIQKGPKTVRDGKSATYSYSYLPECLDRKARSISVESKPRATNAQNSMNDFKLDFNTSDRRRSARLLDAKWFGDITEKPEDRCQDYRATYDITTTSSFSDIKNFTLKDSTIRVEPDKTGLFPIKVDSRGNGFARYFSKYNPKNEKVFPIFFGSKHCATIGYTGSPFTRWGTWGVSRGLSPRYKGLLIAEEKGHVDQWVNSKDGFEQVLTQQKVMEKMPGRGIVCAPNGGLHSMYLAARSMRIAAYKEYVAASQFSRLKEVRCYTEWAIKKRIGIKEWLDYYCGYVRAPMDCPEKPRYPVRWIP